MLGSVSCTIVILRLDIDNLAVVVKRQFDADRLSGRQLDRAKLAASHGPTRFMPTNPDAGSLRQKSLLQFLAIIKVTEDREQLPGSPFLHERRQHGHIQGT